MRQTKSITETNQIPYIVRVSHLHNFNNIFILLPNLQLAGLFKRIILVTSNFECL